MPRVALALEYPTGSGYVANTLNNGWSNNERSLPAFWHSGTSTWHGKVHISDAYASGAPIRLRLVGNVAGNVRFQVEVESTAAGTSDDAPSLIGPQTIALSATARTTVDSSFALPFSLAVGDTLTFKITRLGDDAADTVGVPVFLWDAWLADT